ncbi:response regulator [Paucibacter sp. JuS9]|uniref:response regulator n=1 Tax=Roseateles TaxID=93681 RepID=UPI002FE6A1E5
MPRVIYIEDDRLNMVLMEEVFRLLPPEQQWQLDCAETGAEGLALLAASGADLMLVDMNLPDMNGLELLSALRANAALPQPPCIALSADALDEHIAAARKAGFVDYWLKPIDVLKLLAALRRQLGLP